MVARPEHLFALLAACVLPSCDKETPVRSTIYFSQAAPSDYQVCVSAEEEAGFGPIAGLDNENILFNPPRGLICVFDKSGELRIALVESPRNIATHALSSQRYSGVFRDRVSVTTLRRLRN